MRHALDSGVTLFDLADQYGSNPYFGRAMAGVPRDRYVIQTKTRSRDPEGARKDVDRFLGELGTDYIDSLIVHCVTEPDWTTRFLGVMDVLEEAKQAGKIRSVILVDERATPAQRNALVAFVKDAAKEYTKDVARVDAVAMHLDNDHLDGKGTFTAGDVAKIETRALKKGDCVCTNEEVFYQPLTKVHDASPAFSNTLSFTGRLASDPPLPVGYEDQLFATLRDPSNVTIPTTITWTSETPSIATIDANGVMHALAAGTLVAALRGMCGTTSRLFGTL